MSAGLALGDRLGLGRGVWLMRGLDDLAYTTISALDREHVIPIAPAMLEKDILARDAILAVKTAGQREGCQLVFAGGTALTPSARAFFKVHRDCICHHYVGA